MDNKIAKVIDPQDRYLRHLTDGIMPFWIKHGLDTRHGGFYGALDREGNPTPSLPKSLVQHARFLWSWIWMEGGSYGISRRVRGWQQAHTCLTMMTRIGTGPPCLEMYTRHWWRSDG